MKCLFVVLLCGVLLPNAVRSAEWPLDSATMTVAGAPSQSYFVYVPKGKQFDAVHLCGRIVGAGRSNVLAIYLDGQLIKTLRPRNADTVDAALPALSAGFHRIRLTGSPTTRIPEHQIGVQCPPSYSLPMSVEDLILRYQPSGVRAPWLARLPDGLFNRSYPRERPWFGTIVLSPLSTASETAALRLASDFSANTELRFTVGNNPQADFRIILRQHSWNGATARIRLREPESMRVGEETVLRPRVPTLTITYGDAASLNNAVNALLDKEYRRQLRVSEAQVVGTVAEPRWGTLHSPETLSELGLADMIMAGDQKLNLTLAYPKYWQPTGPIKGHLEVRSQAGLPEDAHLNVWLNGMLAGSASLNDLDSRKIQRSIGIDSTRVPDSTTFSLQLNAVLDQYGFCQQLTPGKLWVNVEQSTLKLPHRDKSGIMQLLPTLVARPLISTDRSRAALDAALAIVQEEGSVTDGKPLPYRIVRAGKQKDGTGAASVDALYIGVDANAVKVFADAQSPRINPTYIEHAVWLHATQNGRVNILASRAQSLRDLSAIWSKAVKHIPDGTRDALVDTDSGQVLVLRATPFMAVSLGNQLNTHDFEYEAIIVLGLIAAGAVLFLWLWWRRRGV